MSFILDALKKSESDRQQESQPEPAYAPTGSRSSRPSRWVWIVGGLLLINVIVLLVFLSRPTAVTQSSPVVERTPEPEATPADPLATQTFRDIVTDAKDNQPAERPPAATRPQALLPDAIPAEIPGSQPAATVTPPVRAISSTPSTLNTSYPTFNDVRVDGSVTLPELHLDIHVYSDTPGERFVFVNMSKHKENSTLSEGPRVAEIVPEGVILEYSGVRFLLPRE